MPPWFVDPNITGLAYDAAGIFVFGVPAVLLTTEQISSAGEAFWDYDAGAMRKLIEQKFDTAVGSLLLLVGFLGQIASALGWYLLLPTAFVAWLGLPAIFIVYIVLRPRLVRAQLARAISVAQRRAQR